MQKTEAPAEAPKASQKRLESVSIRRLSTVEVFKWWNILSATMEAGLLSVYGNASMLESVMQSFATGKSQAWLLFDMTGETPRPAGLVWTRIINDEMFQKKSLMIEVLYGTLPVEGDAWGIALRAIDAFAKDCSCDRITAFSDNAHVMRLAEKFGFRRGYTMLAKDVNHD